MNWEEAAGYSIELDEVDGKIVWRSVLDRGVKVERNEMSCYEREEMLKELYLKVKGTYNGKKLMNYEDDGVGGSQDYPDYTAMKRSGVGSEMDSAERCKQKQPVERNDGVSAASRQIVNALPSLRAKWNRGPVKKKTSFRKRKRAESHTPVCDSKPTMQTLPTGAAGEIHNNVQHQQQQENGATNVSQPPMIQPMPVEYSLKGVNTTPTPSSVSAIVNACWYLLLKELAKSKDDGGRSSEALERLMNPAAQPVSKNDEKLSGEQKATSSGEKVTEAAPVDAS